MKTSSFVGATLIFVFGGLIGASVTYYQVRCQTSGVNIKLDSSDKTGPGITITKTGNDK